MDAENTDVLKVDGLAKKFAGKADEGGAVLAVNHISFTVPRGELFTLLGPSGCGKTTTLRCIAGLERPDGGDITVNGRAMFSSASGLSVPTEQRGLGVVFQSYAIWPHMSVAQNVSFPLDVAKRRSKMKRSEIRERTMRILSVMQLDHLAGRPATKLSGGQQQRLALARALILEPPLLLLDEPLSNLDAKLREDMRFELKRLQREIGITAIFVTHDQTEALAMSNTIAVMRSGSVEQIGSPRDIYERPATRFVADFIGTSNFLDGKVLSKTSDGYVVETELATVEVKDDRTFDVGGQVALSVRPEALQLAAVPAGTTPTGSSFEGTVENRAFLGDRVTHIIKAGAHTLKANTPANISIPPGDQVLLTIPSEACTLIHSSN